MELFSDDVCQGMSSSAPARHNYCACVVIAMKPNSVSCHIVGAFAMTPEIEPRFELVMGWHPVNQRKMTEAEKRTPLAMLRWIDHAQLLGSMVDDPNLEICRLWLKYYPELPELMRFGHDEFYKALWRAVLEDAKPVAMGYGYYHGYEDNPEVFSASKDRADALQQQVEDLAFQRSPGKITWVMPFPAAGPLGDVVEGKIGLSAALRDGLTMDRVEPGLLFNYMLSQGVDIETLLSPRQFEEALCAAFVADGWEAMLTKYTRDGGVDLILHKDDGQSDKKVYVQAKRYSPRYKITMPTVRRFHDVVRQRGAGKGLMVTTSFLTEPAKQYVAENSSITAIEAIERDELGDWLQSIAIADSFHIFR